MLLKKHPEIQPVVSDQGSAEYHRISWSDRRRMRAEYKEKQRRDAWAALEYARNEGRAESQKIIEEQDRENAEQARENAELAREIAELRRKLQEYGGL